MPISSLERDLIGKDDLIRCDAHMPVVSAEPTLALLGTLLSAAVVREDFEARRPFLELHLPVEHDTGGHDDEMRSPDSLLTSQMCNECNCLNGFTIFRLVEHWSDGM